MDKEKLIAKIPNLHIAERLQDAIEPNDTGCLLWLGTLDRNGYPRLHTKRCDILVRRYLYRLCKGDITKTQALVTTCKHHRCVSPKHAKIMPRATIRYGKETLQRIKEVHSPEVVAWKKLRVKDKRAVIDHIERLIEYSVSPSEKNGLRRAVNLLVEL